MRYGVFDQIEISGPPLGQLYRDRLELIRTLDDAGFTHYFKSEHHMIPLDSMPQIGLLFAAAAESTSRIRLGSLVYLLPFHHPLRLAEEICSLDHMLDGRFDVGVGRGISLPEHELWGLDTDAHGRELRGGARSAAGRAHRRLTDLSRRHLPLRRRAHHVASAADAHAAVLAPGQLHARGQGRHEHRGRRPTADGGRAGGEVSGCMRSQWVGRWRRRRHHERHRRAVRRRSRRGSRGAPGRCSPSI